MSIAVLTYHAAIVIVFNPVYSEVVAQGRNDVDTIAGTLSFRVTLSSADACQGVDAVSFFFLLFFNSITPM